MHFGREKRNAVIDSGFSRHRRGIVERAADEHELRPQRERFQHIGTATEAAVDHHVETHRRGDIGQHAQRRDITVQLPPAVVGNDDAIDTQGLGLARILHGHDAFQHQLAAPLLTNAADVLPIEMLPAGKVPLDVLGDEGNAALRTDMLEMRHAVTTDRAQEGTQRPFGMRCALPQQAKVGANRRLVPGAHVVFTARHHGGVDRHHQRLDSGTSHTRHQGMNGCRIGWHVSLVPDIGIDLGNRLQRDQSGGADDHGNTGPPGSAGQANVATVGGQRADAHRCDAERQGMFAPHQRGSGRPPADIDQRAMHEPDLAKGPKIVIVGGIGFRRTGHVTEDGLGQHPPRETLEIRQAEDVSQPPAKPPALEPGNAEVRIHRISKTGLGLHRAHGSILLDVRCAVVTLASWIGWSRGSMACENRTAVGSEGIGVLRERQRISRVPTRPEEAMQSTIKR